MNHSLYCSMQIDFVMKLINDAGVAAVPGRGFFHRSCGSETYHHQYVRFAFCKGDDTLKAAALMMRKLADSKGRAWLDGTEENLTASTSS
jgi:L-glutamine---4-(methylsulfanyl)-2-oxobutanoate aminotransferase